MRSSWPALHAQLLQSTSTLMFQRQFRAMGGDEPALGGFADPASVFDALHGPDGDATVRNAILAALVRLTKRPRPPSCCWHSGPGSMPSTGGWRGTSAVIPKPSSPRSPDGWSQASTRST